MFRSNCDVIYDVMKEHGELTKIKIMKMTGLGKTCVGKYLTKLQRDGKLIYKSYENVWVVI
jgi:predicted transcriptional regulator